MVHKENNGTVKLYWASRNEMNFSISEESKNSLPEEKRGEKQPLQMVFQLRKQNQKTAIDSLTINSISPFKRPVQILLQVR